MQNSNSLAPLAVCDKTFLLLLWNVKLSHMLFHRYKSFTLQQMYFDEQKRCNRQQGAQCGWKKNYNYKRRGRKEKIKNRGRAVLVFRQRNRWWKEFGHSCSEKTQIHEGKHLQPFMLLTLEYNQTLSIEALNLTWGHSCDGIKVMQKKWKNLKLKTKKKDEYNSHVWCELGETNGTPNQN